MAQPTTVAFAGFLVYYGDGGDPEAFTKFPCAMNTRTWSQSVKTTSITVPDQADEDLLVAEINTPDTSSASISGKGTVGTADVATWQGFLGVVMDYKVSLAGVGHWICPMIMTKADVSAQRTNVCELDLELTRAGASVFTAGAN